MKTTATATTPKAKKRQEEKLDETNFREEAQRAIRLYMKRNMPFDALFWSRVVGCYEKALAVQGGAAPAQAARQGGYVKLRYTRDVVIKKVKRIEMRIGYTFVWRYKGAVYQSIVSHKCPRCRQAAVVRLPEALIALQPDDSTHICHPIVGGCNHGFALDGDSTAKQADS